jgi:5'-3' exonuclease
MNTLLVDGDNLLTIGFHGYKNYFYKGTHIGGIFHFLNSLRKSFEDYKIDKIVVFWDGNEGSITRKKYYHLYKDNRSKSNKTEEEENAYNYQRNRVRLYLEELYVRQGEYDFCESDDCIAYYSQNSNDEKKVILSSDGDLVQLVSDNTKIYNPSHRKLYEMKSIYNYKHEEVLIENVKIIKMICGDPSDNIFGIKNLGIKKFIEFFPEVKEKKLTLQDIKDKGELIFKENKNNKSITNLLTGVTKLGVFGNEFFDLNEKIIDLNNPLLTSEAIEGIEELINDDLDPSDRSYKNTMKMMVQDGIFNVLPKSDDAWVKFLNPFLRLTRKEKNKKRIINLSKYNE